MNAATEFDVGPLTWVKGEIDLALGRAAKSLDDYVSASAGSGDPTHVKFCRTYVHQVYGALTIVGLDGLTRFVDAIEGLLEKIERGGHGMADAPVALVKQALSAMGRFLDDLISGLPNQPLRLLPLYRQVQAARGIEEASAVDLFFPDLSARPSQTAIPVKKLAAEDYALFLKRARARFQKGLLAWLRAPRDRAGVDEMLTAVRQIESTQETAAARAFWWVAAGMLAALSEGAISQETDVRHFCARIDLQIRRLLEGSRNVAERLMREALFLVASAQSDHPAVLQIKEVYHLDELIPRSDRGLAAEAGSPVSRSVLDAIDALEELWNKFCSGNPMSLAAFRENAQRLSLLVEQEDVSTDFRRLVKAILVVANWLAEDPGRHSDALAMEVATAILLTQSAAKNFTRLGADFAHQVDVTVARIHACLGGKPPQAGSEIPLLDEMSRRAQERLLIGQVVREIRNNLAHIEQVLDGFFRDVERRPELAALDAPFRQVVGALTMLRQEDAVAVLQQCIDDVKRFSAADYVPQEDDFERLADRLSTLGFFVESLPQWEGNYGDFVARLQSRQLEAPIKGEIDAQPVSVEQEVVRNRRETHALLSALKEQPQDAGLREEVRQNLATLKNDAELVADSALGEQTKAALSALEGAAEAPSRIEEALEVFAKPEVAVGARPSPETLDLSQATNEEIDAELLGIFIEEAHEVLGTIGENLDALKAETHNIDFLTTIRRSFHTLKGSSRMVGLKDVGEAAWAIEQTLNLWLRLEKGVSPALLGLLDEALNVFTAWVRYLEAGEGNAPNPDDMVARAESLRAVTEETSATAETTVSSAGAAAEPSAAPEPTVEVQQPTAEIIQIDFSSAVPCAFDEEPASASSAAKPSEAAPGGHDGASTVASATLGQPDEARLVEPVQADAPDTSKRTQRITISPALFEIFSEEAKSHLETLRRELPVLESAEILATPQDMYRAAHTLAGISATVGLDPVNQLAYALEHALLRRDQSEMQGSLQALGVIRRAIGELELMLFAVGGQEEIKTPPGLVDELEGLYPASLVTSGEISGVAESPVEPARPVARDVSIETDVIPATGQTAQGAIPVAVLSLADEIDEQLLPVFLEEAVEINQQVSAQLRDWRDDPGNAQIVRTLARWLHTLKGSARMAGAMMLGEMAHGLETRIGEIGKTGLASPDVIDEIENAFESVRQVVERLERGESSVMENRVGRDVAADQTLALAPVFAAQEQVAPPTSDFVERRRSDRSHLSGIFADEEEGSSPHHAILRVRASVVDRLVNDVGELAIARSRIEGEMRSFKESLLDLTENVIRLRRQLREVEIQAESQMQSRTAMTDEKHVGFDPLEFDRFTRFQELTRMMAESVNDVATVQQNLLKNLDDANAALVAQARLNREVQQELMSVRMVPFNSLADRMYRIVRQTSKELGKRANLEIKGGEVELDRSVLEKIAAPLEHMLRNAVAHGLEEREMRRARGKPEIGEIAISVKQEGNEIILTLADDGGGLDYERIRTRAISAGLIRADDAVEPGNLAELIFVPGFSTAEALSQIAGRGIGMDVVKTEVGRLGGRVEIHSSPGEGTEFRLIIPSTLAVTKALLVRAGGRTYAIPAAMIEQVLDLKEPAITRIREAARVEWMGHHYPFGYLPHLLGERQALPEQHRQYWVLLLRSGTRRLSVQVDELLGNEEIVVKNIGPQLARVPGVAGATVLGNGQVVLILNPVALNMRPVAGSTMPEDRGPGEALPRALQAEAMRQTLPTVMVVDDSLTVRKITGRLMAREGYQVLIAKDGVEALEQALDVVPDVMLVDIEMPRMDGFELTRNVRADPRLKDVPIIMITSRTADKHRNYAFEIGVNHYLGKPYQEEELLRLVAGYVGKHRTAS